MQVLLFPAGRCGPSYRSKYRVARLGAAMRGVPVCASRPSCRSKYRLAALGTECGPSCRSKYRMPGLRVLRWAVVTRFGQRVRGKYRVPAAGVAIWANGVGASTNGGGG